MKKIDDLSYSGLSEIIQEDEKIGADCLDQLAHELVEVRAKIEELERELQISKNRKESLIEGGKRVLKILGKEQPLIVPRKGYVIIAGVDYQLQIDFNLRIERNVL